jgi:glutamyl-Q tRNA(Asp) synthetase
MEDIDTPRVVPGSAEEIVAALQRYDLEWDGEIVWQSKRTALYEGALDTLRARGLVYDCACSRADLQRAASAPVGAEPVYPGTCRNGIAEGKQARAIRFRSPDEVIAFEDLVEGHVEENVAGGTGDFVVRRADGLFAYQLAVVVDDADQGVTQIVRGADLLHSTARQIALQRALDFPTPAYAHLPLVVNPDGSKLGKRDGALPLPTLDDARVRETLALALRHLGILVGEDRPRAMLEAALRLQRGRTMSHDVRNNVEKSRFETTVDGHTAYAAYDLEDPSRIVFTHTVVPDALAGKGIGGKLARFGLDHAREKGLKVVPQCPFVASFIRKHPEYQDLVTTSE